MAFNKNSRVKLPALVHLCKLDYFRTRFPKVHQFTIYSTRFAKKGDILLSVHAPIGTMNIAKENCCIGRGLSALNSKDNCMAYLLGVIVNLKQIFNRRNEIGTSFGSITKDDLFSLKVIRPDKQKLNKFKEIISPVLEKQNKIAQENQQFTSLRNYLLPKLMNGQVTVGAKEKVAYKVEEELRMAAEPGGETE